MIRRRSVWFTVLVVLSISLLAGCGARQRNPPGELAANPASPPSAEALGVPAPTINHCSAGDFLAALRTAYEQRNLAAYTQLLSADFRSFLKPPGAGQPGQGNSGHGGRWEGEPVEGAGSTPRLADHVTWGKIKALYR